MQRFQERAGESLVWGLLETFINSFSAFVSNLSLQFCGYESFVWAMGLDFTPRIVPPIFFPSFWQRGPCHTVFGTSQTSCCMICELWIE